MKTLIITILMLTSFCFGALGDELIQNGGFYNDDYWDHNSYMFFSAGLCIVNHSIATSELSQSDVFEVGESYRISYDIANYVRGTLSDGSGVNYPVVNGLNSIDYVATTTDFNLEGVNCDLLLDNVSVRQIIPDDPYDYADPNLIVFINQSQFNKIEFYSQSLVMVLGLIFGCLTWLLILYSKNQSRVW